jgi:hypothetical protein
MEEDVGGSSWEMTATDLGVRISLPISILLSYSFPVPIRL